MTPLYVHAVGSHSGVAGAEPADLKPLLKATGEVVRRTNRFIDLALIGARRCVAKARLPERCAVYVSTGQGDVADSALLVEQMCRDGMPPMPFRFVNVSSNTAGFYLCQELGLRHRCNQLVSTRDFPVEALLRIAALELSAGWSEAALVGAVDECAWPLALHRLRLGVAPERPLGEGSHWLLLKTSSEGALARIDRLAWPVPLAAIEPPDPAVRLRGGKGLAGATEAPGWLREAPRDAEAAGFYDTNTGYTLVRFLEHAAAGERLLHVDRSAAGRYAVLALTRL